MGHESALEPAMSSMPRLREQISSPDATPSPGPGVFEITFPLRLADRYVAESEIGRGGMGRVLLGRDEKLRRRVAIKMLVQENDGASDVRRLEREAQILGALNHPNIVAVHDIGLWEGTPFIVSELVDGKTLRELASQGALPWQETLRIGAQIAHALEVAHERGIVHRDLKPENVLLRADGVVKVVDFGLAHSGGRPEAALPGIEPPIPMTSETAGGTVGYMSPEQGKQQPADARSDIFSLAVVLHELLSGRRPFRGSTPMQVGYATAFKAPEPLPESVPEDVRAVLARCLEKDPAQRPQTARELAVYFDERLARESLPSAPALRSRALPMAMGAVALLLASGAGVLALSRRSPPPTFQQLTFHSGAVWSARFAPDGKKIFYTEGWDEKATRVYSTTLDNPREARLEADDASILAVSPQGGLAMLRHPQIVCYGYRGTLDALSSTGSPVENAGDADFAPDGSCRAVIRGAGTRDRLEFPEGHVLYETAGWLSQARVSPDGQRVAFYDHPLVGEDAGSLLEVDRAGKVTVLAADLTSGLGLAWGPSGDEVWFTAAKKTDAQRVLRAASTRGVRDLLATSGNLKLEDVSRRGDVLLTQPQHYLEISFIDGDSPARDLSHLDQPVLSSLSDDGSLIVFGVEDAAGRRSDLYLRRTGDQSAPVLLGAGSSGTVSPDDKWVVRVPLEPGAPLALLPIGGGSPREVPTPGLSVNRARMLPDGERLLLLAQEPGLGVRLYLKYLDGRPALPLSPEGLSRRHLEVSPDGARVAVVGANERIALYPSTGGSPAELAELGAGLAPIGWRGNGELLVAPREGTLLQIDTFDLATRKRAHFKKVDPVIPGTIFARALASGAGRFIAYVPAVDKTHLYLATGVH